MRHTIKKNVLRWKLLIIPLRYRIMRVTLNFAHSNYCSHNNYKVFSVPDEISQLLYATKLSYLFVFVRHLTSAKRKNALSLLHTWIEKQSAVIICIREHQSKKKIKFYTIIRRKFQYFRGVIKIQWENLWKVFLCDIITFLAECRPFVSQTVEKGSLKGCLHTHGTC